MSDLRHAELLTRFGGSREKTVVKIYFMRDARDELLYTGKLNTWQEFFETFRPYFRWRVRPEGDDVAVIITNERSGWFVEKNRAIRP